MAGQRAAGFHLPLPPWYWDYNSATMFVLFCINMGCRDGVQVLVFTGQV